MRFLESATQFGCPGFVWGVRNLFGRYPDCPAGTHGQRFSDRGPFPCPDPGSELGQDPRGDRLAYCRIIREEPTVRTALTVATILRAAYNELMAKYPSESATSKDACFDYHCSLDFL